MNKNLYRVIFNQARGTPMVVAENATTAGPGSAPGARSPSHGIPGVRIAAPRPLALALLTAFGAALLLTAAPPARAQIVADANAPGKHQPTVLQAANGVPQVDIQTPSAAGVSRNRYSRFEVERQGAILNNSRTRTQTQLGGWIQGNPWLARGSAKVILNEVNGSHPSLLRGYVEVAGERAELVIANPAGITCDGCGFINAQRSTLTTGTPILDDGRLAGYLVTRGTIAIEGAGLDASGTDYTAIVARAAALNAGVWANTLEVTTGANRVEAGTGAATRTAGSGAAPAFALDVSQLGGMYADKIVLVGTEAGLGVRNAGHLGAAAGELVVTADGRLENRGSLGAAGALRVDAAAGIDNTGTLYAEADARLATGGDIANRGTIAARGDLTVQASGASSRITSEAGAVLAAGLERNGSLTGAGTLALAATQSVAAHGVNVAGAGQSVKAGAIDLSGSRTLAPNIDLTAVAGDVDLSRAHVEANHRLTVQSAQAVTSDGGALAADRLALAARSLSNVGGEIVQTGFGPATVTAAAFDNRDGTLSSQGDLALAVGTLENRGGRVQAAGLFDLDALRLDNAAGQLTAGGPLQAHVAHALGNAGGLIAAEHALAVSAGTLDNAGGTLGSVQGDVRLAIDGAVGNRAGRIEAAGDLQLAAGELDNRAGFIGARGALFLDGHTLDNRQGGTILGAASVALNAARLDNRGGQLQAAGDVGVRTGELDNRDGLVRSGATLTVAAERVDNTGSRGEQRGLEGAMVALTAHDVVNTSGAIRADTALTLESPGRVDNSGGLMSAGGHVTVRDAAATPPLKTLTVTNTGGTLIAGERLAIDSASLSGDGALLSHGDLSIALTDDYVHSGELQAAGDARLATAGALTNQARLAAGGTLELSAEHLDNAAGAEIAASRVLARGAGTLANRGLIDGIQTHLETPTLDNLGSGRIYGDHVALAAGEVHNLPEHGQAPVIAARERLDLGAARIANLDGALLFSAGDMAIGGTLNDAWRATGQADELENRNATIEALGTLALSAAELRNLNGGLTLTTVTDVPQPHDQFTPRGTSVVLDTADYPGAEIGNVNMSWRWAGEYQFREYWRYVYTGTTTRDAVAASLPASILAGGDMRLTGNVTNRDSTLLTGGALAISGGTLQNLSTQGRAVTHFSGTQTYYDYDGWKSCTAPSGCYDLSSSPYHPPPVTTTFDLATTRVGQHTAAAGTGTRVAAFSGTSIGQGVATVGTVSAQIGEGPSPASFLHVALPQPGPGGPAGIVRTGGFDLELPNNRLFHTHPAANARYLVETDPRFASYRQWLSSDYLLERLGLDPALSHQRLGDGFYERRLIREQVAQLTGQRHLAGHADDEAQYRALMEAGLTFASEWQLVPGVALSAEQMARLTTDIVWLVEHTVALPDGSARRVLVPQLYVRVREGDLDAAGALIAADRLHLELAGELTNHGTLAGRSVVALTAESIRNLGGRITAADTALAARQDIAITGGRVEGLERLAVTAGRDLTVASTTQTAGENTRLDRVAGLYVTSAEGLLVAAAGRDLTLTAAEVRNDGRDGETRLTAGRDLTLATVAEHATLAAQAGRNRLELATRAEGGSTLATAGDLTLIAGRDLSARAATLASDTGTLAAAAGRDLTLAAGEADTHMEAVHKRSSSGFLSSTRSTTTYTEARTTALATTASAERIELAAGRDLTVTASHVVATGDAALAAGRDLTLAAGEERLAQGVARQDKGSGPFSGGGASVTLGRRNLAQRHTTEATFAAPATVASLEGDVTLTAGEAYRQTGSDVLALQGDIDIAARRLDLVEARETQRSEQETRLRQSGITVAVTSPVISAVQTAQQMSQAAKDTQDPRMQALAAASTGLAAYDAYGPVKAGQGITTPDGETHQVLTGKTNPDGTPQTRDANAADKVGGINVSISLGSSKSQSTQTATADTARGSTVIAGGNINLTATGAGPDSDITVRASQIRAGNDVALRAEDEIELLAAANTAKQRSANKGGSASVGIGFALGGQQNGFTLQAGASRSTGRSEGAELTWSNTHLEAGNILSLQSGADTTLKGAVVEGRQVIAEVGGDLAIESLQDTSTYDSRQSSVGASVSLCIPPLCYGATSSGSVSASQAKVTSDYASVTEQSAIRAGDGGFQLEVQGNTDLKGGLIASTDAAIGDGRNRLVTGTLTVSDIDNHSKAEASSSGITLGTDMSSQGKYGLAKAVVGNAIDNAAESANARGQTRSAVSEAAVTITDEQRQIALAGMDAEATLAALNRDTADAHTAVQKQDVEQMQRAVAAEQAIKQAVFKEAVKFSDEAYRVSFLEKAKAYRVERDEDGRIVTESDGRPKLVELSDEEKRNLQPGANGKINVFTNGIFNSLEAAGLYAAQMSEIAPGDHAYLIYYPEADNALSELMVAGFQRFLEGGIGDLSNAALELKALAEQYGTEGLNLIGHSRGSMTIGNALEVLASESGSPAVLSATTLKFVGPAYSAEKAATLLDRLSGGQQWTVQLQNHADDFVGTLLGRNPATYDTRPNDSNRVNEWSRIFGDAPTVHSCYGTGEVSYDCGRSYGQPVTVDVPSRRSQSEGDRP